ncbi:MAG: hypothetical protein ACQEQ4_09115 [Fibrobacterota bacterium]
MIGMIQAAFQDIPKFFRPAHARVIPNIVRAKNIQPGRYNIHIQYPQMNSILYQKPFMLDFSPFARIFGGVDLDVINTYTLGRYVKNEKTWRGSFYFPLSLYKDSWFGVYFIMDDLGNRGRRFMLHDSEGDPRQFENIKSGSCARLIEMDQRCIYFSSKQGTEYTLEDMKTDFYMKKKEESPAFVSRDHRGRKWKSHTMAFKTKSALTDTDTTKMSLTDSIRAYCGLPSKSVYARVSPWHDIELVGRAHARYFPSRTHRSFWAVCYYCGTRFTLNNGDKIDTWTNTDLSRRYDDYFKKLRMGVVR